MLLRKTLPAIRTAAYPPWRRLSVNTEWGALANPEVMQAERLLKDALAERPGTATTATITLAGADGTGVRCTLLTPDAVQAAAAMKALLVRSSDDFFDRLRKPLSAAVLAPEETSLSRRWKLLTAIGIRKGEIPVRRMEISRAFPSPPNVAHARNRRPDLPTAAVGRQALRAA